MSTSAERSMDGRLPAEPIAIGELLPRIVTTHVCGLQVVVTRIAIATVHSLEDFHGPYGRVAAGELLRRCPCCGKNLDRIPWDEYERDGWNAP